MTDKEILESFFKTNKIKAEVVLAEDRFPLNRFFIKMGAETQISDISKYSREIGLALKALDAPIVQTLYKEGMLRLEVMLGEHPTISYSDLENQIPFNEHALPCILGAKNIVEPLVIDLQKAPHILLGGTTGSGKSIMLHAMINSLMQKAALENNVKFALIDPKQVEFIGYKKYKNLFAPIANSPVEATSLLESLVLEMEARLANLKKHGARDISGLKPRLRKKMPYIVLFIDELSDLFISNKKSKSLLIQLAQKSRAAGIHIVAATQHPSAKIIPGELKANFPYVIGCKVASAIHSRILFENGGAEKLLGNGDAILNGGNYDMQRFKGCYLSMEEIEKRQKLFRKGFFQKRLGPLLINIWRNLNCRVFKHAPKALCGKGQLVLDEDTF